MDDNNSKQSEQTLERANKAALKLYKTLQERDKTNKELVKSLKDTTDFLEKTYEKNKEIIEENRLLKKYSKEVQEQNQRFKTMIQDYKKLLEYLQSNFPEHYKQFKLRKGDTQWNTTGYDNFSNPFDGPPGSFIS